MHVYLCLSSVYCSQASDGKDFSCIRSTICSRLHAKKPHSIVIHRNNVAVVLLEEYSSDRAEAILHSSLSINFEGESATDLSGLTREMFSIFFRNIQENYFDGNVECIPRVDPQTCQSLACSDDTMFTTIGKIISHCYLLTGMFPIFIAEAAMQSVMLSDCPVGDEQLVSSFLRYVDDFERDAILSIMNEKGEKIDEEVFDNVVSVLSRCQSSKLPTRDNIRQLISSAARSELLCRPMHALQAIHNGLVAAHPQLWKSIKNEDLSKLYADLIPTPRGVWKLISPVNERMNRQEEKVYDFLRRFVLSLNSRMLGLFLRFISGSFYAGSPIKVDFHSQPAGFQRSPLANTCSPHLHLSRSYMSLTEFKSEFLSVLNNSDEWYMDMQ